MSNSNDNEATNDEDSHGEKIEKLEKEVLSLKSENEQLKKMLANKKNEMSSQKKRIDRKIQDAQQSKLREVTKDLTKVRRSLSKAISGDQDEILSGIKRTLKTLDRVLEDNGIKIIEPKKGDEVDPTRHEVVSTEVSEEYPRECIVKLHSAGYQFEDTVLRPARVTSSK